MIVVRGARRGRQAAAAHLAADLEHSLSGNYARGALQRGSARTAFLAVADGETQDPINNSLTFGLLWLDRLRNGNRRGTLGGLRVIVPKDRCSIVAQRIAALARGTTVELYERDPMREELEKIDARRAGNLQTWLVPRRDPAGAAEPGARQRLMAARDSRGSAAVTN